MFLETRNDFVSYNAFNLYNYAGMGVSYGDGMDWVCIWPIVKIILSLVWNKRNGFIICIRITALYFLLDGMWSFILGIGEKPYADETKQYSVFSGDGGCHNGNNFGKLCKSILGRWIYKNIFLTYFYNIWYWV